MDFLGPCEEIATYNTKRKQLVRYKLTPSQKSSETGKQAPVNAKEQKHTCVLLTLLYWWTSIRCLVYSKLFLIQSWLLLLAGPCSVQRTPGITPQYMIRQTVSDQLTAGSKQIFWMKNVCETSGQALFVFLWCTAHQQNTWKQGCMRKMLYINNIYLNLISDSHAISWNCIEHSESLDTERTSIIQALT